MSQCTDSRSGRTRIAYIMSRFPKLTETFVFKEIIAMEKHGFDVEIYPLRKERAKVTHPEAEALVQRAHFYTLFSFAVIWANLSWMVLHPLAYASIWWTCLRASIGSTRYFFGSIGTIPLAALFAQQMKSQGVQHVHCHFVSHPAVAGLTIRKLVGIPFSYTAHGSDLHREHRLLREKTAACKFAVTISDYNREWIAEKCGETVRKKVHVIHCGVQVDEFHRTPLREMPSPVKLLCIGTLHEVKGQEYLLAACTRLKAKGVPFELHLVGDGPDREKLQRQAWEDGIEHQVRLHGACSRDEVLKQIQQADVVVTPSVASKDGRREGIPVVIMEAMASGKPVIASRISGIPELVEHDVTGVLVPPRNSQALAEAIERLAKDTQLRYSLVDRAMMRIREDFDQDHEAGKLARLIRDEQSLPQKSVTRELQEVC